MSPLRSSAGPAVCTNGDVELGGDDLRERRLAEAGRAGEQHVVERLAAGGARPRATRASCSRSASWPTKSSSVRGRSERSSSSSPASAPGVWMRGAAASSTQRRAAFSALCEQLLGAVALGDGRAARRPPAGGKPSPSRPSRASRARVVAAR